MTYLLIHGGGTTARFWDRLVPLLDGPTIAVDMPGRNGRDADLGSLTVDQEVASILCDVAAAEVVEPITVVAHSSGGLVVPGLVAGLGPERVERIVLNAALVPSEGGCGLECMQPRHREALVAFLEARGAEEPPLTTPGPPADPEDFRTTYGGDPLDDDALEFVVDPLRCVADTVHHYFQPVRWSMVEGIPITYVINNRDRPIPTGTQTRMLRHLPDPVSVVHLDTGHIPAVTVPDHFAAILTGGPTPGSLHLLQ